ncbi:MULTISPECIES: NAD(P)-dependent alcohol dehydrogenase [unclassified Salinibacterium]|uniref:NAD(P)-dependent alcohol dehydrogenase n=1 Tax=unclassified Salinibacterium TaxID=2632331 RepID=UPI0018CF19DE|nr:MULTISPECIES: NAD(P)-dependent alcohol dehydrogenase [unclassified Salinibacterium]MBH0024823.1 NAD(P)-dependent alcohol dehydrogenase [Salinibacterium sp. SWN248]MBH0054826.1 NAD(P)-dependent alcohol dehydrogenase [Salinibacterium sp. SWN139]MBH0084029.1 NAD(P)-dependent alcohol dehydrogenase [Salinibacterium sp. SWN167]
MKAAVLKGHDQPFVVEEVTLGELAQNEVLVRVVGAGMCHTDMLPRIPEFGAMVAPVVLGHEGSGVVEKIGSAVTRTAVGDHVLMSFDSCGWCESCLRGAPAYCVEFELRNVTGRRADGSVSATTESGDPVANRWFGQSSFAEYSIATERNIVVVDKEVPLDLLGPLGCGIQTGAGSVLNEMKLAAGQSIAIFGAGAVGLSAVMAAKIAGASEIVVIDLNESRLEMALELGATRVVRGDDPDVQAAVVAGSSGVDFTFETTAVSSVIQTSITVLARPGKAVLVGAGGGDLVVAPNLLAGRTVTYALEGSSIPQIFIPQLLEFWKKGLFPFEKLIRTYPLADINQAEADSLSGVTIKPVLVVSEA